jgi:hypothetical protein
VNHENVGPLQAVGEAGMSIRRQTAPRTPIQKPGRATCGFVIGVTVAVTLFLVAIIAATIGDFAFEITPFTNAAFGIRLFTNTFDHFVGSRHQHSLVIGRWNVEVSLGTRFYSIPAHDYANVAVGGRPIPALTSRLYSPPLRLDIPRMDRTFWRSFSPKPTIHPPEMALSDGNDPGECWAFAGYSGQLGIQLLEPIQVTSFTIEHTWNTSFTNSAPRNVVLWGLVSTVDPSYTNLSPTTGTDETLSRRVVPQFGVSHVGIHLASVIFDAIRGQPRQTFPLRHVTRQPFDHLVAQFLGNWGHPDYTCLYRLEIHGSKTGIST